MHQQHLYVDLCGHDCIQPLEAIESRPTLVNLRLAISDGTIFTHLGRLYRSTRNGRAESDAVVFDVRVCFVR